MTAALHLEEVTVVRDGTTLVGPISWTVEPDERWIVLGLNGCGKSTLLKVASLYLHPSRGRVHVLGHELGRTDVRKLRPQVGYASAALADSFRPEISARDVVMTALNGALEPWWHTYTEADEARAEKLLTDMLPSSAGTNYPMRSFNTMSSGERQRVLLARTLMTDPAVVLLDEPTAALDLAGREDLVADLSRLAADPAAPAMALVTHHVEEIPPSFTHVLMMRDGEVVTRGPLTDALTADALSSTFGMNLTLERRDERWMAFAAR